MHASTVGHRGQIAQPGDRQRTSTTDNQSQRQRDCAGPGELREPVFIDEAIVQMCRDELDAVNLCIDLSRMSDETLCERLGIDKGHWSRMRKGRAHFPTAKRIALMQLAGNWAPLQYELGISGVGRKLQAMWAAAAQEKRQGGEPRWQGCIGGAAA